MERIVLTNRAGAVLRVFQVPSGQRSRSTRRAMRKLASERYGKTWGELHGRGFRVKLLAASV